MRRFYLEVENKQPDTKKHVSHELLFFFLSFGVQGTYHTRNHETIIHEARNEFMNNMQCETDANKKLTLVRSGLQSPERTLVQYLCLASTEA